MGKEEKNGRKSYTEKRLKNDLKWVKATRLNCKMAGSRSGKKNLDG